MSCKECLRNPVYVNLTNIPLCKRCFLKYFERKVLRTVRNYKLLTPNSNVLVAFSAGKDSAALLHFLAKFKDRLRISVSAVLIDEGIKGYRDQVIELAKKFCHERDVELKIVNYRDFYGVTLDDIMRKVMKRGLNLSPCGVCGTLRRSLINKIAKEMGVDVVATGHNEDDEAQNVILNIFKNNFEVFKRLGIKTSESELFVERVKPFYFMKEQEILLYAKIMKLDFDPRICPYSEDSFRREVRNMLNSFDERYKGVVNGIVSFYTELKKEIGESEQVPLKQCKICGDGTRQDICAVCKLRKLIGF